jgi:Galactose oxidase-like, Early set domain
MNITRHATCLVVLTVASAFHARAQISNDPVLPEIINEQDRPAPVDWGYGPRVRPDKNRKAVQQMMAAPGASTAPVGGADAMTKGVFGEPVTWPIIAIHVVLLPDGRVMNFGTDEQGRQGAQYIYDVWDPQQGTGTAAHMVLPNTTSTDIFCAGQSVFAASGEVLITGGDLTINGRRNFSTQQTEIFHPQTNAITTDAPMQYARWYPTIVALPTGEMLALGGREASKIPAPIPEVFTPNVGWRTLWDAASDAAFGGIDNWYYPRSFVAPNGTVFVLGHDGNMFFLDPAGNGTITQLMQQTLGRRGESLTLPTVMFAPGRLLSVRAQQKVVAVDLNGPQPVIAPTADISQRRYWSDLTVLPNGKVLLTGGSAVSNQLIDVAYAPEIWDPATGQWTLGAKAAKARLYHSTALLLPDGTVLTAGGGAVGPVNNMNAEIYYPPYLYDASGQPAARPSLVTAPESVKLHLNQPFAVTVGSAAPISRVTLLRTGATTHQFDSGQRFMELGFTQAGQTLTIRLPTINPNVVVPGYYMLFVLDQAGVPSVAKIIRVLS